MSKVCADCLDCECECREPCDLTCTCAPDGRGHGLYERMLHDEEKR